MREAEGMPEVIAVFKNKRFFKKQQRLLSKHVNLVVM